MHRERVFVVTNLCAHAFLVTLVVQLLHSKNESMKVILVATLVCRFTKYIPLKYGNQ